MNHTKWCDYKMQDLCPHWEKNQLEPESTICDACKVAFEAGKQYGNIGITQLNDLERKQRINAESKKDLYEVYFFLEKCKDKIKPIVKEYITEDKKLKAEENFRWLLEYREKERLERIKLSQKTEVRVDDKA